MNNSSRARALNRAEVVDARFLESLEQLEQLEARLDGAASRKGTISDFDLLELFESQLISRQLDLMARVKRAENKVFYTIGSSGHEGHARHRSGFPALPFRCICRRTLSQKRRQERRQEEGPGLHRGHLPVFRRRGRRPGVRWAPQGLGPP